MQQVAHGDEVLWVFVASGFVLGCLENAVESFEESVGDSCIEPVEDEFSHLEEGGSHVLDMFESRFESSVEPDIEEPLSGSFALKEDLLELESEAVGPSGLGEVVLAKEAFEVFLLPVRKVAGVLQPEPSGSSQFFEPFGLFLPGVIDGFGEHGHQVKLVEGDSGIRESLCDPRKKRRAHIAGELEVSICIHSFGFKEASKLRQSHPRAAFAAVEHTPSIQVYEHGDVVVPAPSRRFIDSNAGGDANILSLMSSLHPIAKHSPKQRVVNSKTLGRRKHRHLTHQRDRLILEQVRKPATGPCPRHFYRLDFSISSLDPGHLRVQKALVLKEIRMSPLAVHRVVDGQTVETAGAIEVDVEVQGVLS